MTRCIRRRRARPRQRRQVRPDGPANDNISQPDGPRCFTQELQCPDCGQKGTASWEENSSAGRVGSAQHVVKLSEGFHVEEGRSATGGPLVICNVCDTIQAP
jgi:hypothetical protein